MKRCPRLTETQKKELSTHISESDDVIEVKRGQAVLLVDSYTPYKTIESLTGYKERATLVLRQRYLKQGLLGIEHKRKGKPKSLLTKAQREEILVFLSQTTPEDHGYESVFWTTAILAHLIKLKYGVVYKSKRPFYLLFEEAKFSFHKPGSVYEKRDEAKVKAWQEAMKPRVEEAFQAPNTVILCADEMVLSSTTTFQKIWLKKGEYPKIEVSNTKKSKSIYGFLNIKTGQEHGFIRDWQNMYITVDVLKEVRQLYPSQKIMLFWDGAGWHRGSAVQEWMQSDGNIEAFYFPPYSPEENPQEHVWKSGRKAVTHNKFIPDINQAASEFVAYLNNHTFLYTLLSFTAQS